MDFNITVGQYLKTNPGRALLEKYSLDEVGIWKIEGECPNADFIGSYHCPTLGYVEGRLGCVIAYGIDLPKFWQWGYGGEFTKIDIVDIKDIRVTERRQLREEQKNIKERLAQIDNMLDNL